MFQVEDSNKKLTGKALFDWGYMMAFQEISISFQSVLIWYLINAYFDQLGLVLSNLAILC